MTLEEQAELLLNFAGAKNDIEPGYVNGADSLDYRFPRMLDDRQRAWLGLSGMSLTELQSVG